MKMSINVISLVEVTIGCTKSTLHFSSVPETVSLIAQSTVHFKKETKKVVVTSFDKACVTADCD